MKYIVTLNGRTYEVEVEQGEAMILDEYEALAPARNTPAPKPETIPSPAAAPTPAPAPASEPVGEGTAVRAPLPGNVLSIPVTVGQKVQSGDLLLVLEAMKMENEVLAPCDGTVRQIPVTKGSLVATGDLLVVI